MRGPSRACLLALAATGLWATLGCMAGVVEVRGVDVWQYTAVTPPEAPPGAEPVIALDIVEDHGALDVHELFPCAEPEAGCWFAEPDEDGRAMVLFPVATDARPEATARYRLRLGFSADGEAPESWEAEVTGVLSTTDGDSVETTLLDGTFHLRWWVAILH